jgi:hypothetical protein
MTLDQARKRIMRLLKTHRSGILIDSAYVHGLTDAYEAIGGKLTSSRRYRPSRRSGNKVRHGES